ncbi:MAG: HAD family phosphatase [Candidatus Thermoplasmatota archaeon]|nr:HAD family phosphatase [Candidatus Thermoplasmatota archaeon]MCL5984859.1 HAD family phosphatase [Candidatus Thermoplasmatota archaeon]
MTHHERPLRLVAFDMDGTLVDVESSWAYVHHHFGENNDEAVRAFMNNEIDDAAFVQRDLALWRRHAPQISTRDLEGILAEVPLMPGAHELMSHLHAHGIQTVIISGGLEILAERIRRELGMDRALANGFETDANGVLLRGIVRVPVKRKEEVLRALQAELGISPEETGSVGNSEIDVGLFRASRIGVAFNPQDDLVLSGASVVVTGKSLKYVIPAFSPK